MVKVNTTQQFFFHLFFNIKLPIFNSREFNIIKLNNIYMDMYSVLSIPIYYQNKKREKNFFFLCQFYKVCFCSCCG